GADRPSREVERARARASPRLAWREDDRRPARAARAHDRSHSLIPPLRTAERGTGGEDGYDLDGRGRTDELRRKKSPLAGTRGRHSGDGTYARRERRHDPPPGWRPRAPERAGDDG